MITRKQYFLILLLTLLYKISISCAKSNIGYIEVRNKTQNEISDVNWGEYINLGTISAGEEKGKETELSGNEFINLIMNGKEYRSKEQITIDARTSATFIIQDTSNITQR